MEQSQNPPQPNQAPPPIQSLPVEQTAPATPPPNKPKLKLPILIAVIILAIIVSLVGGFFTLNAYIRNEELKPNTKTPTTTQPTLALSPTPDPTADWKTYLDYEGFSFKYPSDWYSPYQKDPPCPTCGGTIRGFNLEVAYNGIGYTSAKQYLQIKTGQASPFKIQELSVPTSLKGLDAVMATGFPGAGNPNPQVFIIKGPYVYSIKFESIDDKTAVDILSTFKFISTEEVTMNWKTYNTSGFSFKYPNEFELDKNTSNPQAIEFTSKDYNFRVLIGYSAPQTIVNGTNTIVGDDTVLMETDRKAPGIGETPPFPYESSGRIIKNDIPYEFNIYAKSASIVSPESMLKRIISTFKFTNSGPQASPSPATCPTPPTCSPGKNLIHGEPDVVHGDYCASYVCM